MNDKRDGKRSVTPEEQAREDHDLLFYGNAFYVEREDGSREYLDPTSVHVVAGPNNRETRYEPREFLVGDLGMRSCKCNQTDGSCACRRKP